MADFKVKWGGQPVSPSAIRVRQGGGWISPQSIYTRQGGAWVKVWPTNAPFQASLVPSTLVGSWPHTTTGGVSRSATVNCSGGTGSYSIVSRTVTGGATISHSGLTVTVSATGRNTVISGSFTVVVTDGVTQITLTGDYVFYFGTGV